MPPSIAPAHHPLHDASSRASSRALAHGTADRGTADRMGVGAGFGQGSARTVATDAVDPLDPHTQQSALLAGRLFACCAQMQSEVIGYHRLAADHYLAAMRRPAKHLTYAIRVAAHYVRLTERRHTEARPAAQALWREIESLLHRLRGIGGLPQTLTQPAAQGVFADGFSVQWRRSPAMSRRKRRALAREVRRTAARPQ